jgi:hypothetical protein
MPLYSIKRTKSQINSFENPAKDHAIPECLAGSPITSFGDEGDISSISEGYDERQPFSAIIG